jgi:hypothetical protein
MFENFGAKKDEYWRPVRLYSWGAIRGRFHDFAKVLLMGRVFLGFCM